MRENLRIWVVGAVLVGGVLLAGGWFVGAAPLLASASANDDATAQAQAANQALQVKLLALQAAQRNIGALRLSAAKVADAVPSSLDAQSFVNRLNVLAAEDDVKVASLSPGTPLAYTQPDGGTGRIEAFTSPQISAANLAVIPMNVQVTGSVKQMRVFLSHVQHDSRLFLVNGVTITAPTDTTAASTTLSGYVYALKDGSAGS